MLRGTYIGFITNLRNKTALAQLDTLDEHLVTAQFDDLTLPIIFTHGWLKYRKSDFIIQED